MEWFEIVWELRQDKYIRNIENNSKLADSYYSLKGLVHMSDLGVELTDEFILEVINLAIEDRNKYVNEAKKFEYVKIEDGEFVWESSCYM